MRNRPEGTVRDLARYAIAPILLASYPCVFLYRENADVLTLSSLPFPLVVCLVATSTCYLACYLILRKGISACNACLASMPFLFLYGALYGLLLRLDVAVILHQTLLPVVGVVAGYTAWFASRLEATAGGVVERAARFLIGGLLAYNVLSIAIVEYGKSAVARGSAPEQEAVQDGSFVGRRPDVYYILLDEFAGFDAVRAYSAAPWRKLVATSRSSAGCDMMSLCPPASASIRSWKPCAPAAPSTAS